MFTLFLLLLGLDVRSEEEQAAIRLAAEQAAAVIAAAAKSTPGVIQGGLSAYSKSIAASAARHLLKQGRATGFKATVNNEKNQGLRNERLQQIANKKRDDALKARRSGGADEGRSGGADEGNFIGDIDEDL